MLNYTAEETKLLDQATVLWLAETGVLNSLGVAEARGIQDIENLLRNGVLLCTLVERLFKHKLTGVFKEPRTEVTCLQNIRKSLEVLRKLRKMD